MKAQMNVVYLNSNSGNASWALKSEDEVGANFSRIFSSGYETTDWVPAVVPGTVFTAHVEAGLEEKPEYGGNIYNVDKEKYNQNFWYRTEFEMPEDIDPNKRIWLNFDGVNRDATIYLNGNLLGSVYGHVFRGKYEIADLVNHNDPNVLAVLVYIPVPPMNCSASPTYIASASWDWMPYVPDLNMGITDEVFLSQTMSVSMVDPWIRTKVPDQATGEIDVSMRAENHSDQLVNATLSGVINPGGISFEQVVSIPANSSESIVFNKNSFSQLVISNPDLWWPNGYGDPNLYDCHLECEVNGQISDSINIRFGIREYSYDTAGGVLHVHINGQRVFLKGGNWGMSEFMLRHRGEAYATAMRLHKEMNFNMVRNWTGAVTDDEFYEQCDENGLMIWDDFWLITTYVNWPRSQEVFEDNVIEKIKRRRNYASVAVWCGMNEYTPPDDYIALYQNAIATYDGNDRHFQPNSAEGNLSGSGPWTNTTPADYFDSAPTVWGESNYGLRSEIGTAVFTTFESFKEFMPEEHWWPRDEMWNKHFFGELASNASPDHYEQSLNERYGTPTGIEEFCKRAQLLNIETNKAMYEGWLSNMWDDASGVLTWMSHPAYPSFVWQTYDYYYDLTGAYWGAKKACEPIHIQWNASNDEIEVVNTTVSDYSNLTASLKVINLDGQEEPLLAKESVVNSFSNSVTDCFVARFGSDNLALNKSVVASGVESEYHPAENAIDGNINSRFASNHADDAWIYVDLGNTYSIDKIVLQWEASYGVEYKLQVSDDAVNWTDIIHEQAGDGGEDFHTFTPVEARYVKMQGINRVSTAFGKFGYSLFEFDVYETGASAIQIDDVHFLKLELMNSDGNLLSENFYWRSKGGNDFSALNQLTDVELNVSVSESVSEERTFLTAEVRNPENSGIIAFANRVQVYKKGTGERVLPVFISDGYFSLQPGELKTISVDFKTELLEGNDYELSVIPYNNAGGFTKARHEITEKPTSNLTIYPNPVHSMLYVEVVGNISRVEVYSTSGDLLIVTENKEVNVSDLQHGVYVIKVINDIDVANRLFIKQ